MPKVADKVFIKEKKAGDGGGYTETSGGIGEADYPLCATKGEGGGNLLGDRRGGLGGAETRIPRLVTRSRPINK